MLVRSRKLNESIIIDGMTVTVLEIRGDKVRLGVTAPSEVAVFRNEIADEIAASGREPVSLAKKSAA